MKPPILEKNYFDILVEEVSLYYKELGQTLDFSGFKDTLAKYGNLDDSNFDKCWEVGKELNMWSEYLSNIYSYNEKLLLDSTTEKNKEFAIASLRTDGPVAKGDRSANKDENVVKARKNRNLLQSFSTALEKKIEFCNTAYHHCKYTCQWLSQPNNSIPLG